MSRWIGSARTDAAVAMEQLLSVGVCHNLVQGLETMRAALSDPLISRTDDPRTPQPNDGNRGFLRTQARLAVVFLADEDDHSGFDASSYIQFLQAVKGTGMGHRVTGYSIVPTDSSSCMTAGPPGPRFADVARQTGGRVFNICSGGYGGLLDSVATRAAGLQRDFRLSSVPLDPTNMLVRINTTRIDPPRWSWDAATNSVRFVEAPLPGQRVTVRYQATCD